MCTPKIGEVVIWAFAARTAFLFVLGSIRVALWAHMLWSAELSNTVQGFGGFGGV
jgi:hypothetical protein